MGVSGCKFEVFEWKLAVFGVSLFAKIPHNWKLDVRCRSDNVLGFGFWVSHPDGWAEMRAGIGVSALRARRR